jgi:protein transport protein SEC13
MHQFPDPCYRASWSVTGNVLAISSGESDVSLWKKQVTGEWTRVADVDDPQQQMQPVGEEGAM